jgi:hypothetical protein
MKWDELSFICDSASFTASEYLARVFATPVL